MKLFQKDKENCLKNKKRNTLSGCKGHPNSDLNLKTPYVLRERLDSSRLIKTIDHLDLVLTHVGKPFKILFKPKSIKML